MECYTCQWTRSASFITSSYCRSLPQATVWYLASLATARSPKFHVKPKHTASHKSSLFKLSLRWITKGWNLIFSSCTCANVHLNGNCFPAQLLSSVFLLCHSKALQFHTTTTMLLTGQKPRTSYACDVPEQGEGILPSSGIHSRGQEAQHPTWMQAEGKLQPWSPAGSAGFSPSVSNPVQCWANGAVRRTTTTVNVCTTHHESRKRLFHSLSCLFLSDEKEGSETYVERKPSFKYILFGIAIKQRLPRAWTSPTYTISWKEVK